MKPKRNTLPISVVVAAVLATSGILHAQTFTWTNLAGGSWADAPNWDATPTFGPDVILDFSTLNIAANATTTLDGNRTAGTLKFGDATTSSHDWIVNTGTSGTLTLATTTGAPVIQVVNRVATINAVLAGTQGFEKTGTGTLILGNSANTVTGAINISAGILQIRDGSTNSPTVFNNLTGKSITVKNTGTLDLARLHASSAQSVTWTLPSITLESGSTLRFRASTGTSNHSLAAGITTSGTTTINNNGGGYGQDISLTGILTGSGTINYLASTASSSSTATRTLTLNNTSTSFSGNWFVDYTASTSDDFVALRSGAAGALGTGSVTLDRRAQLINNASNGINSLSGVTLNQSTSSLVLNGSNAWTNSAATLTANNGTVELGTGASSIGTLILNSAGTVTLNSGTGGSLAIGSTLDIRQGTLTGTGGLTSSAILAKTTTGTAIISTNNAFTGGTTISAGTLQVGNGGISGTIGTGDISNDGTLVLNRSDAQVWDQQISGTGSFTIRGGTALTLTNTHSYTGTTRIEGGSSLTLSGTGGNRLATTSSLAFAGTSSLALGSNHQTVASLSLPVANADSSTTITGAGTLTINGSAPFNFGVSGNIGTNVRTAAMDMTGLAGFAFNSPAQVFRVSAQPSPNNVTTSGSGRPDSSFLASNNTSITALSFLVGDQAGSGTGGNNTFRLGETTTIHANTINIGASGRSNATLNFNSGLTAPKVTIRATDGTSRVNTWEIGRVAHFNNTTWTATADFSGGEIDALVGNLRIAILNTTNQSNRQGTQNSAFTMGKGVLDVTSLVIGEQSGTGAAGGNYAANGTFTLNHADGLLKANSIRLAENTGDLTGGTRSISGTLNLQSGTIEAAEIRLGDQTATSPAAITRNFNFSGGTVRNLNGGDLTISNISVNLTGAGTRVFEATTGQSITIAADALIGGTGGFTKTGLGSMTVESASTFSGSTSVSAGTLFVSGQLGTSDVTVESSATFGGTGSLGGDLAFNAGSFFFVTDFNDPLAVTGTVTFGSGFGIDNITGIDWQAINLGTYTLIDSSTDFSLAGLDHFGIENAYALGGGRSAYFQNGSLQVVVIPEPGAAMLGGLGVLMLLRRRRP